MICYSEDKMFLFGIAVPLNVYQDLVLQNKFSQAFEAIPAEERSSEKIVELYNDLENQTSYQFVGDLTVDGDHVSGTTGSSGVAYGQVPKGDYRVSVDPIDGVDVSYPDVVSTRPGGENIFIGVKKGNGETKAISDSKAAPSRGLVKEALAQEANSTASASFQDQIDDQAALTAFRVEVYFDANGNGVADQGEESLPWAGVKINLDRVSTEVTYELVNGWNFISFPIIPSSIRSAAELIQDVAEDGGYVTTVSTWDGDRWDEYSQRGEVAFGHDFLIEAGRAYFLENHTPATWTVSGTSLPDNFSLPIVRGWNGVGIPLGDYTAEKVLDSLQQAINIPEDSESKEVADQFAQWDFGLWDVFVKRIFAPDNTQTYGFDFTIEHTKGYFIYANQDLYWKP